MLSTRGCEEDEATYTHDLFEVHTHDLLKSREATRTHDLARDRAVGVEVDVSSPSHCAARSIAGCVGSPNLR